MNENIPIFALRFRNAKKIDEVKIYRELFICDYCIVT